MNIISFSAMHPYPGHWEWPAVPSLSHVTPSTRMVVLWSVLGATAGTKLGEIK